MPTYSISGPDGKTYSIDGPAGATREQIIAKIKEKTPSLAAPAATATAAPAVTPADGESYNPFDYLARKYRTAFPEQAAKNKALAEKVGRSSEVGVGEAKYPMAVLKNTPGSAARLAKDIVHPFIHPQETYEAFKNIGIGVAQKWGIASGHEQEKYADALGQYFKERYGSVEGFKKAFATDPVGVLADASMIFSGGGSALARAPGIVGKVGEVASRVGHAIDPLSAAGAAVRGGGHVAAEVIGGLGTHTGGRPIREAAEAGYAGGTKATEFQENLRGQRDFGEVVNTARGAVQQIRKQRGKEYRDAMDNMSANLGGLGGNPILNFDKIDDALVNITGIKTFKGKPISRETQEIRQKIGQLVQEWKMENPAEFHTAEGLDALKQEIGEVREATDYGTPARKVADEAYHAIRQTVVDAFPEYARIMKGYEEASKQIKEIERTLSLNPGASVDTALRKLQSALRNNVNTNFGQRERLAEYLVDAGAPHLMQALAGQALSSWIPRGLAKMVGTEILASGAGLLGAGAAGGAVGALAALPFMSPRLVGEGAYYAGKAARLPVRAGVRGAYATGRTAEKHPLEGSPLRVTVPVPYGQPGL